MFRLLSHKKKGGPRHVIFQEGEEGGGGPLTEGRTSSRIWLKGRDENTSKPEETKISKNKHGKREGQQPGEKGAANT